MFVTLDGKVTLVNAEQYSKAPCPMLIMVLGMLTLVKLPQP